MKKLIFLMMVLSLALLTVACGSENATTAPTTTKTPIETTPTQTTLTTTQSIVTSTLTDTTTPDTTPDTAWKAKIEKNLFEKAVKEDGKYYIYLTYKFQSSSYAVHNNETFVDANVADRDDIVFANLDNGAVSQGIYLRASAEEIEAYAKNSYVTGIYSYPADKVIDGCKATFLRGDCFFEMSVLWENAECGGQLPLYKINSKEELTAFVESYIYRPGDEFQQVTSVYNDAYFAEKTLFLMASENSTGSEQYSLIHVLVEGGVQIVLEMTRPVMITNDIALWLILVEVENSAIENQTAFEVIVK